MRIGNVALEHRKQTHHVGPVDVVSTTWFGRMGDKVWSRSRPTRVIDSESGDQVKVRHPTRITLGAVAGIAVIGGVIAWLRGRT